MAEPRRIESHSNYHIAFEVVTLKGRGSKKFLALKGDRPVKEILLTQHEIKRMYKLMFPNELEPKSEEAQEPSLNIERSIAERGKGLESNL